MTPDHKIVSNWAKSKVGNVDTKNDQTSVKFNFHKPDEDAPETLFETSLENMISSSLQV